MDLRCQLKIVVLLLTVYHFTQILSNQFIVSW